VGASSRKSVELINGGSTTIERVLSTHRHARAAPCARARRRSAGDANPLDRLVSKYLKQTGASGFIERY
jgi:hypothetical protein